MIVADSFPANLEAERAVLGAVLVRPEALDDVPQLHPEDFKKPAHVELWRAMRSLAARGEVIDLVTLKEELGPAALERVGAAYIPALIDGLPRSTNIASYAAVVRDKAILRSVVTLADRLGRQAQADDADARQILADAEARIFALGEGASTGALVPVADTLPAVREMVERWSETRTGVSGVPSGFYDLDHMTHGWQPGDLIILAARPGMGKSAFAGAVSDHAASRGEGVAFFSLEMSRESLVLRQAIARARVSSERVRSGRLKVDEFERLGGAFTDLARIPWAIDDTATTTVLEMRSKCRRMQARDGLGLVVVDYLQLMGHAERAENRNLEVAAFTRGLKGLAKELKVPVMALSQLSRGLESRSDKRPMLSDLRDSGAIEQDADVVLMLYREEYYNPDTPDRGICEVLVRKQRNGATGTVKLRWIGEETRFENVEWRQ